jgi:hypothetical protein
MFLITILLYSNFIYKRIISIRSWWTFLHMRNKIYLSYKHASLELDESHTHSVHFLLLISVANYSIYIVYWALIAWDNYFLKWLFLQCGSKDPTLHVGLSWPDKDKGIFVMDMSHISIFYWFDMFQRTTGPACFNSTVLLKGSISSIWRWLNGVRSSALAFSLLIIHTWLKGQSLSFWHVSNSLSLSTLTQRAVAPNGIFKGQSSPIGQSSSSQALWLGMAYQGPGFCWPEMPKYAERKLLTA